MSEKRFESAVKELEEIVEKLNDTDIPLEESINLYERGVKLSKLCAKKLKEVQEKIETLSKDISIKDDTR